MKLKVLIPNHGLDSITRETIAYIKANYSLASYAEYLYSTFRNHNS